MGVVVGILFMVVSLIEIFKNLKNKNVERLTLYIMFLVLGVVFAAPLFMR